MSIKHMVLSALGTGALGGVHTYSTDVWIAYGICNPFSELFGHMRSEIALFPSMVRIREAGNRIVLVHWPTPTLVTEKSYACTTKQDELERVLSCGEIPILAVFQHLYQLKGHGSKDLLGFYYFSPHEAVTQFRKFHIGRSQTLETLITVRDPFRYCLEGFSLADEGLMINKRSLSQLARVVGSDINLLIAPTDHKVIVGARIDQGSKYTSSGTDSLSLELDEVMDIDSLVGNTCKKHKTTSGAMRISYASKEERNIAQLERRSKKRTDPVGVIKEALSPKRFLPVNLPSFTPPISSLIIDADVTPSPTARISPLMPVGRGTLIRGNEGSFPWHGDLSAHEYSYNLDVTALRWQTSILKAIRPSNTQLPSALSLCSFLYFLLSEANVVGLRYEEAHQKELANFKTESTRVSKQHRKMMKENKVILKQNEYLTECLAIVETKANRLECEVAVGKKSKEALQAELDRLTKEHVAETDRIIFENVLSSISKLKINILLHAEVVAGPFDVCKMDFDALEEVDISSLGFDVLCPSGYDSSSANLNIIARRFALANYFGGYGSLPANLNVTIGSFALTNYFEGCSSSLANLNTIVGALLSLTVWRLRLFACKP
ncbi:hypothetical protein PVK06_028044 [Gossypium arboreum]|uniref:Uncharacterized protein n=1 Tax=Gossypium arboreum TaxID=29729 RepID=A0ABR0P1W9_GOSAR|nr:hypothetical protein PVK06_028044 [Gossypium arboreum]